MKNVLALNLKDINDNQQSLAALQTSLSETRTILATLYYAIAEVLVPSNVPNVKSILLSTPIENEDSSESEDDDDDLSNH